MLLVRSLAFNIALYINTIAQMIIWAPLYFLLPRKNAWFVPKFWAASCLWLHKILAGARAEISGVEHLPSGPCIIAPKHQSFWDTIAFLPSIPDALYILKRELMWIPLFGWYVAKMRMIPIDRGSRSKALRQAVKIGRERMRENRQLIIYPEGTRRPPGAGLQIRHRRALRPTASAGGAGGACGRPLLAAAQIHALSGRDPRAFPAPHRARALARGIPAAPDTGNRSSLRRTAPGSSAKPQSSASSADRHRPHRRTEEGRSGFAGLELNGL